MPEEGNSSCRRVVWASNLLRILRRRVVHHGAIVADASVSRSMSCCAS